MSSYTNIFGGSPVQPSEVSYLALALSAANTNLSWPTQFQDTNNVVSHIIDITPDMGGRTVTLPNATQVSVGQDILINNPSGTQFALNKNDGTLLSNVAGGNIIYFYLIDNTTVGGTWRIIPFGGGVAAVTSVNADVPAAPDSNNLMVAGGPITAAGTLHFSFGADIEALISFGNGTGIAARTAANTWALRSIQPVANGNVVVNNGNGVGGNITIDLAPDIGIAPSNPVNSMKIGNIQIDNNTIISANANGNIELNPDGTGEVRVDKTLSIRDGELLKFYNDDDSHYISFSGSAIPAGGGGFDLDLTWPAAAPTAGQVLQYQGLSALGWGNVPTFFGPASTNNAIAKYNGTGGQIQNSGVIIDAGNNLTSPSTINAGTFFTVGTLILSSTNIMSTTAGSIIIAPIAGSFLQINSNTFIGTTSAGGNRALLFPYLNFTATITPPVLTQNSVLTLPNVNITLPTALPGSASSIVQGDIAGNITFSTLTTVFANKATMETPVSTINPVVPQTFQYHPGVAKSRAKFAGATGTVSSSYNVAAVARAGAGVYNITFTTNFSDATYSINVSCDYNGASYLVYYTNVANTGFTINAYDITGLIAVDPNTISFSAFGTQ